MLLCLPYPLCVKKQRFKYLTQRGKVCKDGKIKNYASLLSYQLCVKKFEIRKFK